MAVIRKFFASHRATLIVVWSMFGGLICDTTEHFLLTGKINWLQLGRAAGLVLVGYMRSPSDKTKVTTKATGTTVTTQQVTDSTTPPTP